MSKSVSRVAINLIRTSIEQAKENVYKELNSLLKQQSVFEIYTEEDIENGDFNEEFDYTNDITGNVIPVHVIKVDKDGIYTCDVDDEKRRVVKITDLSSLEDQISLLELMLTKLN